MSIYSIPATRTKTIQDRINAMADVFENNVDLIVEDLVTRCFSDSGLSPVKLSSNNVIQLMNSLIIPQMQSWEVGWSDNPNDPNNPSMKGVSLYNFIDIFDGLFTYSSVDAVYAAAQDWFNTYPLWKSQPEFSRVLLALICGRPKLGGLFIYYFFCNANARYPLAVMTEDPWLGFLLGQSVWSSNLYIFEATHANFNQIAMDYGWNGLLGSWVPFITSLGDSTTQFALDCFLSKYNYIRKLSKPEGDNAQYRSSWTQRLVTSDRSDLMLLIKITEDFCLNAKRRYDFSQYESDHLYTKSLSYKQMELKLPD